MPVLHHHPLCPHSRYVRLVLAETGVETELVEERPWEKDPRFLALDPLGATPVLVEAGLPPIPGATIIVEYLDEAHGARLGADRLLPADPAARIETRRLAAWFDRAFHAEASGPIISEKIWKRFMKSGAGGGGPDMGAIRAARARVRHHLGYLSHLAERRRWLAGATLSLADLAAAAHLSSIDYLGDVNWEGEEAARDWYARVKSRPSFRALLADRVPGMAPAPHYAVLDF